MPMIGYVASEGNEVGDAIKKVVSASDKSWNFFRIYNTQSGSDRPDILGVTNNIVEASWTATPYGAVSGVLMARKLPLSMFSM